MTRLVARKEEVGLKSPEKLLFCEDIFLNVILEDMLGFRGLRDQRKV
jgi:hypothetical protein